MINIQLPKGRGRRAFGVLGSWILGVGLFAAASAAAWAHNPISTKVTWTREIAPLIARRCISCHARNGFAFPLTTYDEARPWAVAIKEEALAGHMPPWGAAPGIGHFANDRRLTRHEMELIAAWVDGGAPKTLPAQAPSSTPAASADVAESQVAIPPKEGSPDVPLDIPTAAVASLPGGTLVPLAVAPVTAAGPRTASVTLQVPQGLVLTAWRFEPGVAALVERVDLELANRWLGTWTPGERAVEFPADAGVPLGNSALFTARIEYREPMERVVDYSRIRVWTTREPRPKTVREATVVRSWRPPTGVELFSVRPTGDSDVQAVARFADGRIEPLGAFATPGRAPHPTYRLARPLALPPGARVEASGPIRLLYTAGATRTVKPNVRRRPRR
jgi:hypothetical protein